MDYELINLIYCLSVRSKVSFVFEWKNFRALACRIFLLFYERKELHLGNLLEAFRAVLQVDSLVAYPPIFEKFCSNSNLS